MALSLQRYCTSDSNTGLNCILKDRDQKERDKSKVITMVIKDFLPESLVVEILSWLPVKTLLQFKSVSKSWYALISSPEFISKQLNNYYNHSTGNDCCLLAHYYKVHGYCSGEYLLFELLVAETQTETKNPPRVLAHEILHNRPMHESLICGPCDGLYYICDYNTAERALWNPALNELKQLPSPSVIKAPDDDSEMYDVSGLGYDPLTSDYKVAIILGFLGYSDDDGEDQFIHPSLVLVYSLRNNSWKYCGDLGRNCELTQGKCYNYVNGCYYWLGSYEGSENSGVVVSFDMSSDTFQEIDVPIYEQAASRCLGIYHDSIAVLTIDHQLNCFDIRTLNEGHWTKTFTMSRPLSGDWSPVGHWKKNKLILECRNEQLVVCDTDTQEMCELAFRIDARCLGILLPFNKNKCCQGIFLYRESLVSLKNIMKR